MEQKGDVTRLLEAWSGGDRSALDGLLPLIYDELRRLARRHPSGERCGHTLLRDWAAARAWLHRELVA